MKKIFKLKLIIILIVLITFVFTIINSTNIQKIIQNKIYPKKYKYEIEKYSQQYNIIYAVIKAESNFNENAVSRKNAKGLMQLMYDTAVDVGTIIGIDINEDNILNPDTNINIGTKYLSILINKYGNIEVALAAYNAGSGNVDNWISNKTIKKDGSDIENVPFKETNNYVRRILKDYKIYSEL